MSTLVASFETRDENPTAEFEADFSIPKGAIHTLIVSTFRQRYAKVCTLPTTFLQVPGSVIPSHSNRDENCSTQLLVDGPIRTDRFDAAPSLAVEAFDD
jgi:hypothetical protein